MSLTTWLTDYLFTPLRMSLRRFGTAALWLAIFINMIAVGLWHDLTWTFLAFGVIHGIYMIVSVQTLKRRNQFFQKRTGLAAVRVFAAPLLTFHLVAFSLIFFRAESFTAALKYVVGLYPGFNFSGIPALRFDAPLLGVNAPVLILCGFGFLASDAVTLAVRRRFGTEWFDALHPSFRRAVYGALMVSLLLMFKGNVKFIYARF